MITSFLELYTVAGGQAGGLSYSESDPVQALDTAPSRLPL